MAKKSIRAEKTPPRKSKSIRQMVDFKGLPLSAEQGNPLISERESYDIREYGADYAPSVVLNSDSYQLEGRSITGSPAALPIVEQFPVESEVSKSLLGVTRETTQIGLFDNVSSYGLDTKDWRIETPQLILPRYWYARPSSSGPYYEGKYEEISTNAAIALTVNPSPFTLPPVPNLDALRRGDSASSGWSRYLNSIIALSLIKHMVENFTPTQRLEHNLTYLLSRYPPITNPDGSYKFNELYWDKIWLDIEQNTFGELSDYPVLPSGVAYNLHGADLQLQQFKSAALWGQGGNPNVIITEAGASIQDTVPCGWDSFFFNTTRVFFPVSVVDNAGHFRIKTTPVPEVWEKYHGLRWEFLRQDLKDWKFTIHSSSASVSSVETQLKLPYFVLDSPIKPDAVNNTFSTSWPSASTNSKINLPTTENIPGGSLGISSQVVMSSVKPFRYQPGRISGFTYGVKASEIGAGPGTTIEWGVENETDAYVFRLEDGAKFSIVRRSTIPLERTEFLQDSGYTENTQVVVRNGRRQFETIIDQKLMNGDPLSGAGESGYIIDLDTVTMYKIEFGWYGAIGARFYVYVPTGNGGSRWVILHTLIIENQLGKPCLADPFFFFKYRLQISNSSAIRVQQFIYKFGASYYIDGADEGTLYPESAKSKIRLLGDPKLSLSKTKLNAIDWRVLMGVKPQQFLYNRVGTQLYNKKQIFPTSFSVYSQQDCEIKIIQQRGCPEFAYTHQEGYRWPLLPPSRRLKGKFSINPLFNQNYPGLEISSTDPSSQTAVAVFNTQSSGGFRDISVESNWAFAGDEELRLVGLDLFSLVVNKKDFTGGTLGIRIERTEREQIYLSSRDRLLNSDPVSLPFTYAPVPPYENGYDIEADYFRRDQTLLSSVNVSSNEFYIYWAGKDLPGIDSVHRSSLRFGFAWPTTNPESPLYEDLGSDTWGIEQPASPGGYVNYDGEKFYDGLPVNFAQDFSTNSVYVESNYTYNLNAFRFEFSEEYFFRQRDLFNLGKTDDLLSVPGADGGVCRGLGCRVENTFLGSIPIIKLNDEIYYLQSTSEPWPNIDQPYQVTVIQGTEIANFETTGGIEALIEEAVVFLLPLGGALPTGFVSTSPVKVEYNNVYIGSIDRLSRLQNVLVSKIAPGRIPFFKVWVQGRQGAQIGGVWVGQRTPQGILLDPFTPHRSTLSIIDSGVETHGEYEGAADGALKAIVPITQLDNLGTSTAPTTDADPLTLDTYKSIHTNPRKCGSFLSEGGINSAGIFTPSDYPVRWLTSPASARILSTYYIGAGVSTTFDLTDVFNYNAESIVNDAEANLATMFIARSLSNHNPVDSEKEIYVSLNYNEQ